ncbi:MAG: GspH/FimT family pseudopilin [Herminiimonas sp.]|nr:GspH/FimT family pseudopilin [Herminiimonas sp.]
MIELLTVISIVAILSALAAPSFVSLIASQRIKTAASSIQAFLNLTRAEALKRNASVTMSPNSGTSWNTGWKVTDPASGVVLYTATTASALTITGPDSVVYQRSGRVGAAATGTFKLASTKTPDIRCIEVNPSGVGVVTSSGC